MASKEAATAGTYVPRRHVNAAFVSFYIASYAGGALLFLAPLLVSLALKVNDLVGTEDAPKNLALIAGVSSLLAMVSNPLFGRLSDRTAYDTAGYPPLLRAAYLLLTVGLRELPATSLKPPAVILGCGVA